MSHSQAAERSISASVDRVNRASGISDETVLMKAQTTALLANAEATLALAEEQRTANLIALYFQPGVKRNGEIEDEILDRLGLERRGR